MKKSGNSEDYKFFDRRDIQYAESLALLDRSRQKCQERYPSRTSLGNTDSKPSKFNETKMRKNQIIYKVTSIKEILSSLKIVSREKKKLEFVAPLTADTVNKRWQNYCIMTRRSLFSLRREVNHLKMMKDQGSVKFWRKMSMSTSMTYNILVGISKYPDKIRIGGDGRAMYFEVTEVTKNLFKIINKYVVQDEKSDEDSSAHFSLSNTDQSLVLHTSEVDSDVRDVLNPVKVRKKLANVASKYVIPKDKIIKSTALHRYNSSRSEKLSDDRKIHFIEDSLSSRIQRRSVPSKGVRFNHSDESIKNKSEKLADSVFEKLIPYLKEDKKDNNREESFISQLLNLLETLSVLEHKRERIEETLTNSKKTYSIPPTPLEAAISEANKSLFETSKLCGKSVPVYYIENPPDICNQIKNQREELWASVLPDTINIKHSSKVPILDSGSMPDSRTDKSGSMLDSSATNNQENICQVVETSDKNRLEINNDISANKSHTLHNQSNSTPSNSNSEVSSNQNYENEEFISESTSNHNVSENYSKSNYKSNGNPTSNEYSHNFEESEEPQVNTSQEISEFTSN